MSTITRTDLVQSVADAQILTNSRLCAEGHRPICQDTGIVNVFLKIGMGVSPAEWSKKIIELKLPVTAA